MEPDRDGAATQTIRQPVVVVPAVGAALVARPVGAEAPERLEGHLSSIRQPPYPDRTILREEGDRSGLTLWIRDQLVFDVNTLRDPSTFLAAWDACALVGRRYTVDRQQPEVSEQFLVVDPAERGVVDDALGARHQWIDDYSDHGCLYLEGQRVNT